MKLSNRRFVRLAEEVGYADSVLFDALSAIEEDLDERWIDSPALFLKVLPPKQKGAVMEKILRAILEAYGYSTEDRLTTKHDFLVLLDGVWKKVELKGSCTTKSKPLDYFSFLQIRPEDDYELLYLAGFTPDDLQVVSLTKDLSVQFIQNKVFKPQHGGSEGHSGTYCYNGSLSRLITIGGERIL